MFLLLVSEWRGSVTLNRPNANLDSKNDAFFVNLEYGIIHRDAFDFYRSQFSSELWSSPTEEPQNKFRVKLCHSEHLSLNLTIINVSFSRKNHGSTALNYLVWYYRYLYDTNNYCTAHILLLRVCSLRYKEHLRLQNPLRVVWQGRRNLSEIGWH